MDRQPVAFWSLPAQEALARLTSTPQGLTSGQAKQQLALCGANLLTKQRRSGAFTLLIAQYKSPIILILLFAAGLSVFLHDKADALIIMGIVLISGLLGFWQEKGAADALGRLLAMVQVKATVLRDGRSCDIPLEEVVPGDVAILNAGDVIPGDCLILDSKDLFVDEATLTGETFPVEKSAGVLPADASLNQRGNSLWMGTHVVSGTATALVAQTGKDTEFGKISDRLKLRPQATEFELGVKHFGYFLMEVTLILVIVIFAINVYFKRPVLDSFLFSLALAVGLTPQLLPAIISINLAHGAKRMSGKKVIVKRLASIENFGSMNMLCSDKTGTLTEGAVRLHAALDAAGQPSDKVPRYAYLNAVNETGFVNPIDEAIRNQCKSDVSGCAKLDEVPYDFLRKRLSILIAMGEQRLLITKGALANVLEVCRSAEVAEGRILDIGSVREQIERSFQDFSGKGLRTLGIAYKDMGQTTTCAKEAETEMVFLGFLVLEDPPKANSGEVIGRLKDLGVRLKIITGDNRLIANHVGQQMGLASPQILTGSEMRQMSDGALLSRVARVDVFAEVEPNQKERIILAFKKAGNVVGYMGDGINDASALHAADVGISVESAADVAKDAADIVLLEKDLGVLVEGVQEGRVTFANTLKYVFMATSANFGNMFSMAGASLFLPFLPLLPKQILLTNLLTDFPEMAIASDSVDREMVLQPRRWDLKFIRRFMLVFGVLSSVFDYLTFGLLLLVFHAKPELFRTGWFIESVISATLIVLVIRSRRPFFKSRPGRNLFVATLLVVAGTLILPFTPLAALLGFRRLPISILLFLGIVVMAYVVAAEWTKAIFYKRVVY
ncbi:MAG: magnesium-translocating P-type ATPase [Candidatus Sumerlaeota bacterium]|nr:magnesium-translocating P-type ATPase [Candidatus Sumerlaeota bacterium]